MQEKDKKELDALEYKLGFQDIRFYRSIAQSRIRREQAMQFGMWRGLVLEVSLSVWGCS